MHGIDYATVNFKYKSRSIDANKSTADADARLYRKDKKASELRFMDYILSNNCHELIACAMVTTVDWHVERGAAKVMIADAKQVADENAQISLGAGKCYDAAELIEALMQRRVLSQWAQNNTSLSRSMVPGSIEKTGCHPISQQKCAFIGLIRRVMVWA